MLKKTLEQNAHSSFVHYPAYQKLTALARYPYDLTQEGNLTPERIKKFTANACDYLFSYGTERVTEEVMHALFQLAGETQALEKMRRMQSGEKLNFIQGFPSENRAVLHTAVRDFFDHPNRAKAAAEATELAKKEKDKLKEFISGIDCTNYYTDLVCIGIGGSDLGPRAHYIALKHLEKRNRRVHFISNIDPDETALILKQLDLKHALVIVISKSGTTLETRANEEFWRLAFSKVGIDPKERFIAVTGEGSPMDDPKRYLKVFYIWDWIGGRYSTTSMVGGVMLSFAFGFDVYVEFLKGANRMDKAALNEDFHQNLPLLGALLSVWNRNFLNLPTLALIPYSQALSRYSAHIQQVEMESNGKHIDQLGRHVVFQTAPIIWGEPGTNAQHSFFQCMHQGTDTIPLELIGFKENQMGEDYVFEGTTLQQKLLSNLFAQAIALAVGQKSDNPNKEFLGNRSSHILLGNRLTPYSLGVLLSYFESKVIFEGFLWGINSFDQEGVQLGKVLSSKLLDCFSKKKKQPPYPLGEAYISLLDELNE